MAPSVEDQAAELALFLDRYRIGPHPILWVGAGASAAAGSPTLAGLEKALRRELPGVDKSGYELADAYVDKYSRWSLASRVKERMGSHSYRGHSRSRWKRMGQTIPKWPNCSLFSPNSRRGSVDPRPRKRHVGL